MAAAVTRELKITYGTFEVGGTSEYEISGPVVIDETYDRASVSFSLLVRGDTAPAFQTACAAVVAAFRARDLRILVQYDSQTHLDLNPSTNSGFNSAATIAKRGDTAGDTGRSRIYSVMLAGAYPATDLNGRRESRVKIDRDASDRMTITYSGTWTAISGLSASDAFLTHAPTWIAAQNSTFGSGRTLERVLRSYEPDRNDKELTFTESWRQILKGQSSAGLDHAAISDHTITMRLNKPAPGDSGRGIVRLRDCTVQFGCAVVYTESQDLDALWEQTILPYLEGLVVSEFAPQQIARVDEDAQYDSTANRIAATVTYRLAIGATNVIESQISVGYDEDPGLDFTGVWDEDPLAHYVDAGQARKLRVTQRSVTLLGGASGKSRIGGGGTVGGVSFSGGRSPGEQGGFFESLESAAEERVSDGGGSPNSSGWNLISNRSTATNLWLGTEERGFLIGRLEETITERWVNAPSSGGGGGGGVRPGPGGSLGGFRGPRR